MSVALFQMFVLALATAAISVTVSKARVFASFRSWVASKNAWFGELISCSYCTSHWVALALTAVYRPKLVSQLTAIDFLVSVFAIVATSAVLSGAIMKLTPFQQPPPDSDDENEVEQLRVALKSARDKLIEQARVIERIRS